MAIFSTRSSKRGADEAPTKAVPIDSIETLRTRARQRLIGAVVLVALGIITFTLLFDSQPRPIPVDIPIIMPDKDRPEAAKTEPAPVTPAAPTASVTPTSPVAETPVAAPANASTPSSTSASTATAAAAVTAAAVAASSSLSDKEEIVTKKPEPKVEPKPEPKVAEKPAAKPVDKPTDKAVAKPSASDEAAKAMAILEGRAPAKSKTDTKVETKASNKATADEKGRFVVQVGAFAENEKARAARLKVERAGLKTYVNVAETPQGKRIRVRAGPFATRAEAEKAAAKIKTLDLPAAILTL